MTAELQAPPLGLYVHLPWCLSKCPYCDFNSHALQGELPAEPYIEAVLDDLATDAHHARGRPVASIFIGGGTPSLFPARQVESLINGIRERLPVAAGAEVTLEANPGTLERDGFRAYRDAGVNRVSLGVQSFDDALLRAIGRIHGRREVDDAVASLHDAGLGNFNIDLMYGLPGQDVDRAARDVELALAAGPAHISHYQLTLEPNTAFAADPPGLPDDQTCWEMQEAGAGLMQAGGFEQYEVSAWAVAGGRCRHNLNYWRFGDYLGVGAGAHGKLTDVAAGEVRRVVRARHPRRYLAGERLAGSRKVDGADLLFEYFLNVLRLSAPVEPAHFEARTAMAWAEAAPRMAQAVEKGLMEAVRGGFRSTSLGWRFMNDLQAVFLP